MEFFFTTSKVIKSKMAAMEFMKCTLCHMFATSYDINTSEDFVYTFNTRGICVCHQRIENVKWKLFDSYFCVPKMVAGLIQ